MISRELQVLKEVEARLKGVPLGPIPFPASLGVDRCRDIQLKPGQLPHVSVYPLEDSTTRRGSVAETPLTVKVSIWVKGTPGAPTDEALDPIWLWVNQQMLSDESLGGLAISVQPAQKVWGFAIAQCPFGDLDLHYLITFRHQYANPSLG